MTDHDRKTCDDLWRQALAAGLVRWMPGMGSAWESSPSAGGQQVLPTFARVCDLPMGPMPLTYCVVDAHHVYATASPVWTDPATIGCLLHLAWEARGDGAVGLVCDEDAERWAVVDGSRGTLATGRTAAEALLHAILAAGGER